MKKRFNAAIIAACVVLVALLTGYAVKGGVLANMTTSAVASLSRQSSVALPTQLALGTLSLEDTDQAVTAEQAVSLLPLWKAVNSLSTSDNVTTVEMNAVYKQIQNTMTTEQMALIQSMDLTTLDAAELAENYGFALSGSSLQAMPGESPTALETGAVNDQQAEPSAEAGLGGDPGGMIPGGEGAPPDSGGQSTTGDSSRADTPGTQMTSSSSLYLAVIDLLESLVQ